MTDEVLPMVHSFFEALFETARKRRDLIVLCPAAAAQSVMRFSQEFPDRCLFFDQAEEDMIRTAAGLSFEGWLPVVFTTGGADISGKARAARVTAACSGLNVKIISEGSGAAGSENRMIQNVFEDFALMRTIPGITVAAPCDAKQAFQAAAAVTEHIGPVYLRLQPSLAPVYTEERTPFVLGRARTAREGRDVAIITIGSMLGYALQAAKMLHQQHIEAAVIDCHTLKPLNSRTLLSAAERCGCIVTVEQHAQLGGLGSAVSELLSSVFPVPVQRVGLEDSFQNPGEPMDLFGESGLTTGAVYGAAVRAVRMKDSIRCPDGIGQIHFS